MTEYDKQNIECLLTWRDAALRTCQHLGMYADEFGAYIELCRAVGHVPIIGGVAKPELLTVAEKPHG